ncbi:MAG: flagellar biosynthesis anti-sigma factor FlgM [Bryobacteraceae bacterium]|nr:flagellar biosynthesis anti-sigma factor FlgM [Bryobacteraceae bacterium]
MKVDSFIPSGSGPEPARRAAEMAGAGRAQETARHSAAGAADSIELSPFAKAAFEREELVERLRLEVSTGAYAADPMAIARRLLDDSLTADK